jgi:hypothetical protein
MVMCEEKNSTPVPLVLCWVAYRALFRAHLDEEALDEIRKASSRGLPLGSERFREQVEAALGRRVGLRPRGRREAEPTNPVLPGQMGLDL